MAILVGLGLCVSSVDNGLKTKRNGSMLIIVTRVRAPNGQSFSKGSSMLTTSLVRPRSQHRQYGGLGSTFGTITVRKGIEVPHFRSTLTTKDLKSKRISNDQELIQSDPTSCPQNQKGNN